MQEKNEQEKIEGGEIVVQNKFIKWLDNFWYHYKWYVIFIAFFVVVFAICLFQCATAEQQDLMIVYAGYAGNDEGDPNSFTAAEQEEIAKLFASMIESEDDEPVKIGFSRFYMYSEREMEVLYTDPETGAPLETKGTVQSLNLDQHKGFSDFIISGQCSVWLVSEYVYSTIAKDRLVSLSSMGMESNVAYDEYAVRLAHLPIYKKYDALQNLPEDTLIVLAKSTFVGNSADQKTYAMYSDLFRKIVEYQE